MIFSFIRIAFMSILGYLGIVLVNLYFFFYLGDKGGVHRSWSNSIEFGIVDCVMLQMIPAVVEVSCYEGEALIPDPWSRLEYHQRNQWLKGQAWRGDWIHGIHELRLCIVRLKKNPNIPRNYLVDKTIFGTSRSWMVVWREPERR